MELIRDTFLPNGRLRQVECALKAVNMGSTAVGVCTNTCVVLAAVKRIPSPLMVTKNVERIVKVAEHIGCAISGHLADARRLIDRTRTECQQHWFNFDESIPVESCTQFASTLMMSRNLHDVEFISMCRPLGVALLFAGFDGDEPQMWHLDPTSTYTRYLGKAIGCGSEMAKKVLVDKYRHVMEINEAIELCLRALQQATEEQLSGINVEVVFMTKENKEYNKLTEDKMKILLEHLNQT